MCRAKWGSFGPLKTWSTREALFRKRRLKHLVASAFGTERTSMAPADQCCFEG